MYLAIAVDFSRNFLYNFGGTNKKVPSKTFYAMKKSLVFAFWMALLTAPLAAQTIEVSGEYHGQVLWDADTVRLIGDVVIEPDEGGSACLTIERGTWVIAEGYYRITVHNGSFYALGADKYPVVFTARDTTDFYNPTMETGWHGIHLLSDQSSAQDSVVMEYCEVKFGKIISGAPEGERFGAGVEVRNKKYCYFAHCHFSQNRNEHNTSSPSGCGGGGIYVLNPGTILVEHCIFHDNYAWWGASISMGGLRHFTVRNCEFYNNTGTYGTALDMHVGELSLYASGPQVYNNYIHGNHGSTAYLGWEGVGRFHDNIIVNNEGYSPVLGTTAPNYSHYYNNTIVNNQSEGFMNDNGSGIWTNGQQKIYNNIVYGNDRYDFYPQTLPQIHFERMDPSHPDPTIFNNCVSCPDGYEGTICEDPQFLHPTLGIGSEYDHSTVPFNWSLTETSPCLNEGATNMSQYYPDTDFSGNPRVINGRIDLGAFEAPDWDAVEEQIASNTVYPNPGRDVLHVLTDWEDAVVAVYDLNGRKMIEQQIEGYLISIATEDWTSGMYFWRVVGPSTSSGTLTESGKWIKE